MFVIDDDDFLLRKAHVWELIERLKTNEPTRGKLFYVETVPMEVEPDIMAALRSVGFRAILLGIESPVERVARHVGKLTPRYAFEQFVRAPKVAHDAGFFTRVTAIPFYPIVTQDDLVGIIAGLADFIDYGVAVSVFPLVKALPGTEFVVTRAHEFATSTYTTPTSGRRQVELLEWVLPDDRTVRALAMQGMQGTAAVLGGVLREHGVVGDYPMSLGVLAFLRSIVDAWRTIAGRVLDDASLDRLRSQLDLTTEKIVRKYGAMRAVQAALGAVRAGADAARAAQSLGRWLRETEGRDFVLLGLRMAVDFGTPEETAAAAAIAGHLAEQGISERHLHQSLVYALGRHLDAEHRGQLRQAAEQTGALG